jgi:hypothetical protein
MKRELASSAGLLLFLASSGGAQDATYQKEKTFQFKLDALARQEWTRDIFVTATTTRNEDRRRFQARPALEARVGSLRLGVGAELNYSNDENWKTATGASPALIRDNYKSRDAMVDLAFADYEGAWVRVQGGRFEMPVGLTEMVWDKDLRPQGGAVTLGVKDRGALKRAGITGLWARGSHVFDDRKTTVSMVSGNVVFRTGETGSLSWWLVHRLLGRPGDAPGIRRQNTRVGERPATTTSSISWAGSPGGGFSSSAEYGQNTAGRDNEGSGWPRPGFLQTWAGDYTYATVTRTPPWPPTAPTTSSGSRAGRATAPKWGSSCSST